MELEWWSPQGSHFRSQTHQLSVDRLPVPRSHASFGVSAHRESVHVHAQVAGNRHAGRGLRGWMMVDGKKIFVEEDRNYGKL